MPGRRAMILRGQHPIVQDGRPDQPSHGPQFTQCRAQQHHTHADDFPQCAAPISAPSGTAPAAVWRCYGDIFAS
jgi:hypothetical protein